MSLAELLAPVWAELGSIKKRLPSVSPATVTSVGPIRIQIDGQGSPVAASPDSLVPVGPGDRVRVLRYGTTHLIIGQVYTGQWESLPVTVDNGWVDEPGRYIHVRRASGGHVEFRCELRRGDAASGLSFTSLPARYRPGREVWETAQTTAGALVQMRAETGGLMRVYFSADPGTDLIRWHAMWGV